MPDTMPNTQPQSFADAPRAEVRHPVAACAIGPSRSLAVVCNDGTVWLWAPEQPKSQKDAFDQAVAHLNRQPVDHTWHQFHTPVPGTEAYAGYSEEAR